MAGEYKIIGILRQEHLNLLAHCGLTVQVLVDCSHNTSVKTERRDRPGQPVIAKPIELDVMLAAPHDPAKVYQAMRAKLTTAPIISPAFEIYKIYQRRMGPYGTGVTILRSRGIKLEIPRFDRSILNVDWPQLGTEIGKAIQACSAKTGAAFNALPSEVRRSMGMYRRVSATSFILAGPQEPWPRTAIL
ncbi:MAG TPA: hypothetical protein VH595_17495 [Verrucomicrobiae bacterium]|jgi:hypothetical protein|nr:hypothetical protein [Verrucomicrobiae bacterium]